jgi:hypothetical protein
MYEKERGSLLTGSEGGGGGGSEARGDLGQQVAHHDAHRCSARKAKHHEGKPPVVRSAVHEGGTQGVGGEALVRENCGEEYKRHLQKFVDRLRGEGVRRRRGNMRGDQARSEIDY